jgi:hypothetical protein
MLQNLKNIFNNMTWYLRSGIAPTNNKAAQITSLEELKNINHMASRKFSMTMVAISVIAFMYFASVIFLFFFPSDPHVSALVSMYKDMIVAVASIAATLVGIQGLVDWKHQSGGVVSNLSEYNKQETFIEEYLSGPKEEDYSLDIKIDKK